LYGILADLLETKARELIAAIVTGLWRPNAVWNLIGLVRIAIGHRVIGDLKDRRGWDPKSFDKTFATLRVAAAFKLVKGDVHGHLAAWFEGRLFSLAPA
jgi:hypothetical protein